MNSTIVAVFGHYDSRGGTSVYVMKERTVEEVQRLGVIYNRAFGWETMLEEYRKDKEAGTGQWQWDPTEPGSSPADQDFMFVAQLWHDGDLPVAEHGGGTDLEDYGTVIIDEDTDPGIERAPLEYIARESLKNLTQLEFIPLKGGRYGHQGDQDDSVWEARVKKAAKVVGGPNVEIRNWNDDAFGFLVIYE